MLTDYVKAMKMGVKEYNRALADNRNPCLAVLDDILKDASYTYEEIGYREIPLEMITGTVTHGRAQSFAANFMPIMERYSEFARKWSSLYDDQLSCGIRDAIKVYEYRWHFYVQEGNKRVSVMKYLDNVSIYGSITRILVDDDSPESEAYRQFCRFYAVCPIYEIIFSDPDDYQKLAEMAGKDLETPWDRKEVANLESCFLRFRRIYRDKGGNHLTGNDGDAFMKYLQLYDLASLSDLSESVLENRIQTIWNELLVATNKNDVFVLKPDAEPDSEGLLHSLLRPLPRYSEKKPLKAAFIHYASPDTAAWVSDQEIGRIYLNNVYDPIVKTEAWFDCDSDEKVVQAIEEAVANGNEVIFSTSLSGLESTMKMAVKYPKIRFYSCSVNRPSNIVRYYYGRLFEAKYLMGMLAAQLSENHRIGYLDNYPLYGSFANMNAFALGAAAVDPQARIHVFWLGDRSRGPWKDYMRENQISIISGHDVAEPLDDNTEYGVFKLNDDDSVINYGNIVWNWGRYYQQILQPIVEGYSIDEDIRDDQSLLLWWGMAQDVIDIHLSSQLSYYTRKTLRFCRRMLVDSNFTVFAGELNSLNGNIQPPGSGPLSGEQIITMDWLNDNIVTELPDPENFDEGGRRMYDLSGIKIDNRK
ncbi:MAG: BMP family ABC transporter substrate-binding protein [Erysipelotrichaceae bacterium]|nr:BMP family ABC transporter substrate-binding protein [Erysipelotrichaceae bacterium]